MSLIGKSVYNVWTENSIRFGKVLEEKIDNKWRYVRVDWKDDSLHDMSVERVTSLRNVDYDESFDWYRIDNVTVFEPQGMIDTLRKLS